MQGISLRHAGPDDALCIGVLTIQVFLDTYATAGIRPSLAREVLSLGSTESIAAQLTRGDNLFVLAEFDRHLIGYAQLGFGASQALVPAGRPVELIRLYVQEPFTAKGVGSRLIVDAQALAAQRGADVMWLTPWVHNLRALRFYAKHGYRDLGPAWYEFEGERHENRVLAKDLVASSTAG